ncbi:MFS transporter [Fluviispira multicolorata]|uniref:MFS transporter n=1 Tax=Fluviispira multicolorata TaxID=2654512 RepID=A0A833N4J1_9BACT|nr:MFS transporter [Fluviispira multicolorata]KAB8032061.1 MFS transporter [Fluviispira multicolorata]
MKLSLKMNKSYFLISAHYFVTHIPFFGFLATLVLILSKREISSEFIALISLIYTISYRASKVFFAPFLDKLHNEKGIYIGCLLSSLGFLFFYLSTHIYLVIASIIIIGFGISINGIATKVLVMNIADQSENKANIFSIITTVVNIAAALSQPAALFLFRYNYEDVLLILFSISFFIPFLYFFNRSKNVNLVIKEKVNNNSSSFNVYMHFLKSKSFLLFIALNMLIWSLFGQIFNTFALHIGQTLNKPDLLGTLYFVIAILIIALQIPISNWTNKLDKGSPHQNLYRSAIAYGLAFLLISFNCEDYIFLALIVAFLALAEVLFGPSLDVLALSVCGKEYKNIWISLVSISTAIGESFGGSLGIWFYSLFKNNNYYWFYIGLFSIILSITFYFSKYFITSVPLFIKNRNENSNYSLQESEENKSIS